MRQAAGFSVVRFTSLDGIQGEKGRKGGEPTFSQRKCSCGFEMFVFHSCGWRFSGFSEVNAGSAPCHQIRFTVTLATVFTAHWLPQLPATSAASWRQLGGGRCFYRHRGSSVRNHCPSEHRGEGQCSEQRWTSGGWGRTGCGSFRVQLSPHTVPDQHHLWSGQAPACQVKPSPLCLP